ncbi:MAG: transcriptional repressor [Acidobacteriales bacterium]|nr:transcriptional repressor [Terriglobales bacterium]
MYERSRAFDPSLSLATVYNNVHRLLELGILREVNPVHGGMRIEMNAAPHYHLICTRCHSVRDIDATELGTVRLKKRKDFTVQRVSVDVLGLCANCKTQSSLRRHTL